MRKVIVPFLTVYELQFFQQISANHFHEWTFFLFLFLFFFFKEELTLAPLFCFDARIGGRLTDGRGRSNSNWFSDSSENRDKSVI